jgi:hypothetical protein
MLIMKTRKSNQVSKNLQAHQKKFVAATFSFALILSIFHPMPSEAAAPKIKIAVVEGYGSERATYSYTLVGNKLTKKKKVSAQSGGLQQFTKKFLVYYDGLGYESGIFKIGKNKNVGESIYYSDRIALGVIGGEAYYRTAIVNGDRMIGTKKNLSSGDVYDLPEFSLKGVNGDYYWYDNMSAPRDGSALYLGANHYNTTPSGDSLGFQIFRQSSTEISAWRYIKYQGKWDFITDFCISPTGNRVAYTKFATANSFRKDLVIQDFQTGQTWSKQGDWSLSGSCFFNDQTLVVGDQEAGIFKITTKGNEIKWQKLKGNVNYPYGEVAVSQ